MYLCRGVLTLVLLTILFVPATPLADDDPAESLFEQATDLIAKNKIEAAKKLLEALVEAYPESPFAEKAKGLLNLIKKTGVQDEVSEGDLPPGRRDSPMNFLVEEEFFKGDSWQKVQLPDEEKPRWMKTVQIVNDSLMILLHGEKESHRLSIAEPEIEALAKGGLILTSIIMHHELGDKPEFLKIKSQLDKTGRLVDMTLTLIGESKTFEEFSLNLLEMGLQIGMEKGLEWVEGELWKAIKRAIPAEWRELHLAWLNDALWIGFTIPVVYGTQYEKVMAQLQSTSEKKRGNPDKIVGLCTTSSDPVGGVNLVGKYTFTKVGKETYRCVYVGEIHDHGRVVLSEPVIAPQFVWSQDVWRYQGNGFYTTKHTYRGKEYTVWFLLEGSELYLYSKNIEKKQPLICRFNR